MSFIFSAFSSNVNEGLPPLFSSSIAICIITHIPRVNLSKQPPIFRYISLKYTNSFQRTKTVEMCYYGLKVPFCRKSPFGSDSWGHLRPQRKPNYLGREVISSQLSNIPYLLFHKYFSLEYLK